MFDTKHSVLFWLKLFYFRSCVSIKFCMWVKKEISCLLSYELIYSDLLLVYLMQRPALKWQGHFHLDKAKFYIIEEDNLINNIEIYHITVTFSPEKKKKKEIIYLSRIDHSVFTVLFQESFGNKSCNTFPSSFGWQRQKAVEPGRHFSCYRPQLIRGSVSRATTFTSYPAALLGVPQPLCRI